LSPDGHVFFWDEIAPKEKDWIDGFNVSNPDASRFEPYEETHTPDYICHWYEQRVREIESKTGLTNLAIDLAKLGVERNITVLFFLFVNLYT
jgi:hypothetical protein